MAISNTSICNMALDKLGAGQINDLDSGESTEAIKCRTHFEQTRDALLRSYWWGFATARVDLSAHVDTPAFEWDYQYSLPDDFLRMKAIYEDGITNINYRNYAIEGDLLLTNESSMSIKYIKRVTDPTKFDELFTETLILKLALKLIALAGSDPKIINVISTELRVIEQDARAVNGQEINTDGIIESSTWNDARFSGRSNDPGRY